MNSILKSKLVGLSFHKVQQAVKQEDFVILVANPQNEHDSDCIEVYNAERELVGYIANSDRTLSVQNRKNGNLSASQLKEELDFNNHKEYYAEAVRVYKSCIYLEINPEQQYSPNGVENNFNSDKNKGGEKMNFLPLKYLCRSPLDVILLADKEGNFSVFFECEGDCFKYSVIENDGIKGVDLDNPIDLGVVYE